MASKRKKLKNSEILEALRDEFGSAPEVRFSVDEIIGAFRGTSPSMFLYDLLLTQAASSSGMVALNKEQARAAEDAEERRRHEEERFVRLVSQLLIPSQHRPSIAYKSMDSRRYPKKTRKP